MKILPVATFNQHSTFKGLWGRTINNDHTEGEQYVFDTRYEYYPFADETSEQIEKVKRGIEYSKTETLGKGVVADPWPQYSGVTVAVMTVLPFTSKEFLKYTMNKLPITKQRLIEKHIINKGLSIIKK